MAFVGITGWSTEGILLIFLVVFGELKFKPELLTFS